MIQLSLVEADQEQPAPVVTLKLPVALALENEAPGGLRKYAQPLLAVTNAATVALVLLRVVALSAELAELSATPVAEPA